MGRHAAVGWGSKAKKVGRQVRDSKARGRRLQGWGIKAQVGRGTTTGRYRQAGAVVGRQAGQTDTAHPPPGKGRV